MNREIFTMPSAQDVPLDQVDAEEIELQESVRGVRSLIREMLLREVISSSRTSHSQGWIDPQGVHHLDPRMQDHGEWATDYLVKNGMERQIIEAIPAVSERMVARGSKPILVPDTQDFSVIYDKVGWVIDDISTKILMGMGWGKVMNAYTLGMSKPSRTVIDSWLNLGMEAGVNPDASFSIYSRDDVIASGTMEDIENYMRRLGR